MLYYTDTGGTAYCQPSTVSWTGFLKIHLIRNKLTRIAAMSENVAYNGRVDGGMFGSSEKKHGFYFRVKLFIHLADAAFKFKVGGSTQAPEDETGIYFYTIIYC